MGSDPPAEYELCPFIRFDKTLTCGGQTDRQTDKHGAAAINTLAQGGADTNQCERSVGRKDRVETSEWAALPQPRLQN